MAQYFVDKYFGEDVDDSEIFWISDDIGGVLSVGDFYFTGHEIKLILENEFTEDDLFEWYDQWIDPNNKHKINIKNWKYKTEPVIASDIKWVNEKFDSLKKEIENLKKDN